MSIGYFFIAPLCGVVFLASILSVAYVLDLNLVCTQETILSVGGCNKDGVCGVMTSKGSTTARLPAVGEITSVCRRVDNGPK